MTQSQVGGCRLHQEMLLPSVLKVQVVLWYCVTVVLCYCGTVVLWWCGNNGRYYCKMVLWYCDSCRSDMRSSFLTTQSTTAQQRANTVISQTVQLNSDQSGGLVVKSARHI